MSNQVIKDAQIVASSDVGSLFSTGCFFLAQDCQVKHKLTEWSLPRRSLQAGTCRRRAGTRPSDGVSGLLERPFPGRTRGLRTGGPGVGRPDETHRLPARDGEGRKPRLRAVSDDHPPGSLREKAAVGTRRLCGLIFHRKAGDMFLLQTSYDEPAESLCGKHGSRPRIRFVVCQPGFSRITFRTIFPAASVHRSM